MEGRTIFPTFSYVFVNCPIQKPVTVTFKLRGTDGLIKRCISERPGHKFLLFPSRSILPLDEKDLSSFNPFGDYETMKTFFMTRFTPLRSLPDWQKLASLIRG